MKQRKNNGDIFNNKNKINLNFFLAKKNHRKINQEI